MECCCHLRDDQNLLADVTWRIFLGRALFAGGNFWEEDILNAEIDEMEKLDASETDLRRLNAKMVSRTQKDGEFVFLVADGSAKI